MTWVYDGSFEGFLSSVARSYTDRQIPRTLVPKYAPITLFDTPTLVETDVLSAEKLSNAMQRHFDHEIRQRIMQAFLCDDSAVERELLLYIRLGFKSKEHVKNLTHPVVYAVEQYQKRVLTTMHKMFAFTRFEVLEEGTLYARIEPPRNVLPLLGAHFVRRLGQERFIIHDLMRETALLHRDGTMELRRVHAFDTPTVSDDEEKFQRLWRTFFDKIAIESRYNPSLQRQFVPLKYRQWMTEFN